MPISIPATGHYNGKQRYWVYSSYGGASLVPESSKTLEQLKAVIARHWGYHTFRPLQEDAMRAVLDGQDSVVVLPTGGGKSLCYQAPAVLRGDTTVVVSPLISLMKDQVDSLKACGVPAIQLDSSQTAGERSYHEGEILRGGYRLLFVSPERLVMPVFQQLLRQIDVRSFAIDEAHCISHWGHDFRPEYRQLSALKELFPKASVHAFTATATEHVRGDIVRQLQLKNPAVLVGDFDRANLSYRILPRFDLVTQVREVLDRHKGEAGIIYCIRRKDVDELTEDLKTCGYQALPYHAGLPNEQRKQVQDAFSSEECDLIVATVAFGMGIDRSNIRFVLHAGMPKSVEHYQQETGRAGRDGLEAECALLYSGADTMTWKWIINKSGEDPDVDPQFVTSALKHLEDMDRYCRGAVCRHRALVQYFGQSYPSENCAACDICLGDTEAVPEAQLIAQKILSCVARVKEQFGAAHVISVLRGENVVKVRERGHDKLSTYGILREHPKTVLRDWVYQLIGQHVLDQQGAEYPVLKLNEASWQVMKGQKETRLVQPIRREARKLSKADSLSWEDVDKDLFEALRELRRGLADARDVPPYVIFSDATLRQLAQVRPSSLEKMRYIYGIGDTKLRDFGQKFLDAIVRHCQENDLEMDKRPATVRPDGPPRTAAAPSGSRAQAYELFRQNYSIEEVMIQTARSRTTVVDYLSGYIRDERPASLEPWIANDVRERVEAAARKAGLDRLKPIFLELGENVSYDEIRIVVTSLQKATS